MSRHLGAGGAAQGPVPPKKKGLAWKMEAFCHLLLYSLHSAKWVGWGTTGHLSALESGPYTVSKTRCIGFFMWLEGRE